MNLMSPPLSLYNSDMAFLDCISAYNPVNVSLTGSYSQEVYEETLVAALPDIEPQVRDGNRKKGVDLTSLYGMQYKKGGPASS